MNKTERIRSAKLEKVKAIQREKEKLERAIWERDRCITLEGFTESLAAAHKGTDVYRCSFCHFWHYTDKRPKVSELVTMLEEE